MSKEKNELPVKKEFQKLSIDESTANDAQSVFDILEAAESYNVTNEGFEDVAAGADYWNPTGGEVLNVMVTGFENTTIENKDVVCVCFLDKQKKKFISGASMFVNTVKKMHDNGVTFPFICRVVVAKDKVQGKNGKYFSMEVFKLM